MKTAEKWEIYDPYTRKATTNTRTESICHSSEHKKQSCDVIANNKRFSSLTS